MAIPVSALGIHAIGRNGLCRATHEPELAHELGHSGDSYTPEPQPDEFPTYKLLHKGAGEAHAAKALPVVSYANWSDNQQGMLSKSLDLLKGLGDPKFTEDAELLERLRNQNRLKLDPNEKAWGRTEIQLQGRPRLTIYFPPKAFEKACASADTPEKKEFFKQLFFTSTAAHEATHGRGPQGDLLSEHDAAHEEVRLMGLLEKQALKRHAPAWQIHMIRAMQADPYQGGK